MTLTSLIQLLTDLIGLTIPIAFGLALFAFIWGIFQAFGNVDSAEKRAEARQTILWSLLALFVVATLAGIIMIFSDTFNLGVAGGGGGGGGFASPLHIAPASGSQSNPTGSNTSQVNPLPRTGGNPLRVLPTGRTIGPSDVAP